MQGQLVVARAGPTDRAVCSCCLLRSFTAPRSAKKKRIFASLTSLMHQQRGEGEAAGDAAAAEEAADGGAQEQQAAAAGTQR